MAIPIILPAHGAAALDADVVAAWAGTDRPTMQALLAAGLPIPLEDAEEGADVAALINVYERAGLKAVAVRRAQPPLEWLKAAGILWLTAVIFRVWSGDRPALMDLAAVPALAGLYTLVVAAGTWAWRRRAAGAMQQSLDTAHRHLKTATPVGPCAALIVQLRTLRREVVSANLAASTQRQLLGELFDLETSQSTMGTLPLDITEAIAQLTQRLHQAAARPPA